MLTTLIFLALAQEESLVTTRVGAESVHFDGKSHFITIGLLSVGEDSQPVITRIAVREIDPYSPRSEPGRVLYDLPKALLPRFPTLKAGEQIWKTVKCIGATRLPDVCFIGVDYSARFKGETMDGAEAVTRIELTESQEFIDARSKLIQFRILAASIKNGKIVGRAVLKNRSKLPVRLYVPSGGLTVSAEWTSPQGHKEVSTVERNLGTYDTSPNRLKLLMPGGEIPYSFAFRYSGSASQKSFASEFRLTYDSKFAVSAFSDHGGAIWPKVVRSASNSLSIRIRKGVPVGIR